MVSSSRVKQRSFLLQFQTFVSQEVGQKTVREKTSPLNSLRFLKNQEDIVGLPHCSHCGQARHIKNGCASSYGRTKKQVW